jgi:hypothetical protein
MFEEGNWRRRKRMKRHYPNAPYPKGLFGDHFQSAHVHLGASRTIFTHSPPAYSTTAYPRYDTRFPFRPFYLHFICSFHCITGQGTEQALSLSLSLSLSFASSYSTCSSPPTPVAIPSYSLVKRETKANRRTLCILCCFSAPGAYSNSHSRRLITARYSCPNSCRCSRCRSRQ